MSYANEIREILERRKIHNLIHFTQAENLPSIIERGLQPRQVLERDGVEFLWTDSHRMDGYPRAVSLSVSDPNYPMLRRKMKKMGARNWIVLRIDPEVLVDTDCRFCSTNAANKQYKWLRNPFNKPRDFEAMFTDEARFDGQWKRELNKLKPWEPTDVQAEILFFGTVAPGSIIGAAAETLRVANFVKEQLDRLDGPERPVQVASLAS